MNLSRHLPRVLIAAGLAAGALLVSGAPAVAASPSVTVTPSTGLGDQQFVNVSWTGFNPLQVVFFRECVASPTNVNTQCTALYSDYGYTDASGAGNMFEPVSEGNIRSASGAHFTCDDQTPCTFGVFTAGTLVSGTLIPISFAPTPGGCPVAKGAAIAGGGADGANRAVYGWTVNVCGPPKSLGVNYISANDQDGRENFINGLNDFAVTGDPFSADELKQVKAKGKTFAYAPITSSALVLAYKIFDQNAAASEPGAQVTDLKLTPQLVAQIFTGQIQNWHSNTDINTLNPGHVFPPAIWPLVRGDHSAANYEFTSWLSATAGSALPAGWPGPSYDYPLSYLTQNAAIVGGESLADAIADPNSANNSNDYFNVGYIGFVDSSEAAYYGLPVAKIENASGAFVDATPTSIAAALSHATTNADGVTVTPDYADTDPNDYPMPVVDYAAVPTNKYDYQKGRTLQAFLRYAVTGGQQALPQGYVPLTPAMVQQTESVIPKIPHVKPPPSKTGGNGNGNGNGNGSGTGSGDGSGTSDSVPPPVSSGGYPTSSTPPPPSSTSGGGTQPTKVIQTAAKTVPTLPTAKLVKTASRWIVPALIVLAVLGVLVGLFLEFGGSLRSRMGFLAPVTDRMGSLSLPRWRRR